MTLEPITFFILGGLVLLAGVYICQKIDDLFDHIRSKKYKNAAGNRVEVVQFANRIQEQMSNFCNGYSMSTITNDVTMQFVFVDSNENKVNEYESLLKGWHDEAKTLDVNLCFDITQYKAPVYNGKLLYKLETL